MEGSTQSFSHSGSIGDIVYSLPFCLNLTNGGPFSMHLRTGVPAKYAGSHPAGSVRLTEGGASVLRRLLERQPYVSGVTSSPDVPEGCYNLDRFRDLGIINLGAGSISQWYDMFDPASTRRYDLSRPWLEAIEEAPDGGYDVVVFRSSRYRRKGINFVPLRKYSSRMVFIGLEEEWKDFCRTFFQVRFHRISDFYEAATMIRRARFVVGNQTGLFSLAEAMKVPRLLETSFECPNVVMMGGAFSYVVHPSMLVDAFEAYWRKFVEGSAS